MAKTKIKAPRAKAKAPKTEPRIRKPDPKRAMAASEVLQAVWLNARHFDLEHKIASPPRARADREGHLWVTVELHVPALDIDAWLDGTHVDDPNNQPAEEQEDAEA